MTVPTPQAATSAQGNVPLTMRHVLEARRLLAPMLPRPPLYHSPGLSALVEAELYVKYENHSPIGSFKARGALVAVTKAIEAASQSRGRALRGVIASSTGNHGMGMAYAGQRLGVPVTVYVPEGANPDKCRLIEQFGGRVAARGQDLATATAAARAAAADSGMAYVDDGDDVWLQAGTGTIGAEIVEEQPEIELLVLPVGGGALLGGAGLGAKGLNPHIRVIGAAAERAPGVYLSWQAGGKAVRPPYNDTFAEGLTQPVPTPLAMQLVAAVADDMVLVSEDAIKEAIALLLEHTHNLAEGAGAAALAGVLQLGSAVKGKKVAIVLTGGNITREMLLEILAAGAQDGVLHQDRKGQ
ncbi:MAG: threonine ammonia-lyase [Dehalococcoidia bacterium]|nr:threonine ammonia-lyase [Dehalococcoidia bacterium]